METVTPVIGPNKLSISKVVVCLAMLANGVEASGFSKVGGMCLSSYDVKGTRGEA